MLLINTLTYRYIINKYVLVTRVCFKKKIFYLYCFTTFKNMKQLIRAMLVGDARSALGKSQTGRDYEFCDIQTVDQNYLGYFCGRAFSVIQGIRMANSEITRISFTTTECRSTIIMISKFWFFITKKQLHITYNSRTSKYIIVNKG